MAANQDSLLTENNLLEQTDISNGLLLPLNLKKIPDLITPKPNPITEEPIDIAPPPPPPPDTEAPQSTVDDLPNSVPATFNVTWYGFDNGNSGLASYDIFVSTDGGEYVLWQDNTTALSGVYEGQSDRTYEFYSVATDNAGNAESTNESQTSTTTNGTTQQPAIYRLFNSSTGVHLYTSNIVERDSVIQNLDNYSYESVAYFAARSEQGVPVYRLYSPSVDGHFYTTSEAERDELLANSDFVDEGAAFTAFNEQVEGTLPVYRFFDSGTGAYFYTSDENERASVEQNLGNYTPQGIAFYSFPLDADFTPLPPDIEPDNPINVGGDFEDLSGSQSINGSLEAADIPFSEQVSRSFSDNYLLSGITPGQQISVNMESADFDTYLEVFALDANNNPTLVAINDDFDETLNSGLDFTVEAGFSYVVAAGGFGEEDLGAYTLTTADFVAPNIDFNNFEDLSGSQSINGSLEAADIPFSEQVSRNASDNYLLNGITPGQQISVNMESADFDTYLEVFALDANNNPTLVAINDDFDETLNSGLDFTVEAGFSYVVAAGGFGEEDLGAYTLTTADFVAPNIDFNNFEDLSGSQSINGSLEAADIPFSDRVSRSFSDDYLLNGITPGQEVSVNMESNDFDAYLEVFALDANNNLSLIISDDDSGGDLNSSLNFNVEAGFSYIIAAGGFIDDDLGAYTLITSTI